MNQTPNARHWLRGDLKAYIDGELPAWRHRLAAWHVERCDSCRSEAEWLKQMNGQFAVWENDDSVLPRPELRARILSCLPAEPPAHIAQRASVLRPQVSHRPAPRLTLALGSLVAILLLMGGVFALSLRHSTGVANHSGVPTVVSIAHADKRPVVLGIFRAPENSFDAADTTANQSQASSENGGSHAAVSEPGFTPTGTAQSYGNPSSSPAPSEQTYSDPTSREAERLASLAIGKMLNERHQRLAAGAKRETHPQPPSQRAKTAVSPQQIVLAVADVSEAREQLHQWAETSGAKMRVMREKGNIPAVIASNGTPLPSGTLLEVRLPTHFAGSLQSHLSQIGTPLRLAGAGLNKPHTMPLLDSSNASGQASVLPPPPNAIATPSTGNENAIMTIRVRLLPGESVLQP